MREIEVEAENKLLGTRRFGPYVIDINRTAMACPPNRTNGTPTTETIITNLETVAESTTLLQVQSSEGVSAVRVRVPQLQPPEFDLWSVGGSLGNLGWRTGYCTIWLEEAS